MLTIQHLTVDFEPQLLSLGRGEHTFGWLVSGDGRGCVQCAYEIEVTARGTVVWNSGRVASSRMVNIPYEGPMLEPEEHYDWRVTLWDKEGNKAQAHSFFETAPQTWKGAKWIGGEELCLSAHTQSVFQFSYRLELTEGTARAAVLFGGNDSRLMDQNKNIQGVCAEKDESFIALVLDIGPLAEGKQALFQVYRRGYAPRDGMEPLHSGGIPENAIHRGNCHSSHRVEVKCVYGEIEVYLDGVCLSKGEGLFGGNAWNLNPVGQGNNFICFPLLCDVGIALEPGQEAVFSDFTVRNYREPCNALVEGWPKEILGGGAALRVKGGEKGFLAMADPSHGGMTMLRTEFSAEKKIKKARLYATARGIYELYLNGKRVGQDWFAPGLSQYNKTHFYQTYDVTGELRQGKNALGAYLGEGWWSGAITFSGDKWNFFGDRQSLLCRLVLEYEDGSRENIVSCPETWQYAQNGPVVYSSFFQGEIYDSRKEQPGWCEPGFQGGGWKAAREIPLSRENAFIGDMVLPPFGQKVSMNYDGWHLEPQMDPSVRQVALLEAQSVSEPRPGVYIYDMGQNMAGVPEITLAGAAGQKVTLRYAEILYPDMDEYGLHTGMLMLENIRGALAQDTVILKEGLQTIRPHFTFHGYRYLEITGISEPLPLEAVKGICLSSVDVTATFSSSSEDLNRLYENICWSLRDNFISIPTDCPQRNERMGWSGDLSVFSRTAVYMANCASFLRRHMTAMRDTQSREGRFDDVAPVGGGFGGILWGSAGITVPWEAYRQFGDETLLRQHFSAMCRYVRYLATQVDPKTGLVQEGPLGDWLGPENEKNEPALLWQCYYVYDLWVVMETAKLLGRQDVLRELGPVYDRARKLFHETFLDPVTGKTVYSSEQAARGEGTMGPPRMGPSKALPPRTESGRYLMDTQTSYAVPLALDVLDEAAAERAKEYLAQAVSRKNIDDGGVERPEYSLMTGFIGTAWLCPALRVGGKDDLAWKLICQESYPSWLYPVKQGATTIWERLDSFTLERGFGGNNSMNSFNHYSFGAVGYWMLSCILGIGRGEDTPSWILEPTPDPAGKVTWAKGSVQTVEGTFESGWRRTERGTEYTFTVPGNGKILLGLPGKADSSVTEAGIPAECAPGVENLGYENGRFRFRLASGSYVFLVEE